VQSLRAAALYLSDRRLGKTRELFGVELVASAHGLAKIALTVVNEAISLTIKVVEVWRDLQRTHANFTAQGGSLLF